ncbi:MAG: bifunctional phosphoribosyl-AMP cyclohydrolase/phosphoribosyl-ATP diphosphatase HisIE [Acidobacteriota bacterium]
MSLALDISQLRFDDRGLLPVVVQDIASGAVLMVAFADREAVERTLASGQAWFWSRSRRALWRKGETSGNSLTVREVRADCDGDTLLCRVDPVGPTCHTGERTCFGTSDSSLEPTLELGWLKGIIAERRAAAPDSSYTARLFAEGLPKMAQKVGEEAVETVVAALAEGSAGSAERVASEAADLLFHLLVLLEARGVDAALVGSELRRRHLASVEREAVA